MKPRYYYPYPEDIKVGLVCEHKVGKDKWEPKVLNRGDFMSYIPFYDNPDNSFVQKALEGEEVIRIKCLDYDDLDELCSQLITQSETNIARSYRGKLIDGKDLILTISNTTKNWQHVSIFKVDGKCMFSGLLRNKQELINILNIIHEVL
jgi:hypothetical protein